jgi:hypothetical protein
MASEIQSKPYQLGLLDKLENVRRVCIAVPSKSSGLSYV